MKRIICTSSSFDKESCIYVIREDVDLEKRTIVLKKNCALKFEGGILRNGIIVGDYTHIDALVSMQIFDNVKVVGTWANKQCSVCWFGAKSTPAISANDGFDCSEPINLAIASSMSNIYFPVGNWYVRDTIRISKRKKIILEGESFGDNEKNSVATIYTNKDIDVFYVCYDGYKTNTTGKPFIFRGGRIYLFYADIKDRYDKSAIHITTGNGSKIWGVKIHTTIYGKACNGYTLGGNGICFDGMATSNKKDGYITDMQIKSYIYGMNNGILIDKSSTGWITSMRDYSTIRCKHAVVMNNGVNSNLYGMYQPLYCYNRKNNGESLLVINVSNVNISSTIWDIGQGRKWFTNQYAVELGDVERITLSGLPTLFSLDKIKGFSTNKVTATQYERLKGGKQFGYDDSYNCLQFGSPYFKATPVIENATLDGFDNLFKDRGNTTITVTDSTKDVVLKIEITPKFIPLYLIGIDLNCSKGGHFRTIELDTNIVQGNETKPYHDEIHPTSTHEWMERWYFSFEKLYVSDKVILTFKDIYPNSKIIKLGRIVGKSNDRYVLTPSGGSLYGDIYKETRTRYGIEKKKFITADTAKGKSSLQLADYAHGCVLSDETSMVGVCENFAGRFFMQNVNIPFVVDGDLPRGISPRDYCGYVKVLHRPSGRFAYFYDKKWHDDEGFDFSPKKGLFSDRPMFKTNTNIGYIYYAIDLKKYITWDGTKWTDMIGNEIT